MLWLLGAGHSRGWPCRTPLCVAEVAGPPLGSAFLPGLLSAQGSGWWGRSLQPSPLRVCEGVPGRVWPVEATPGVSWGQTRMLSSRQHQHLEAESLCGRLGSGYLCCRPAAVSAVAAAAPGLPVSTWSVVGGAPGSVLPAAQQSSLPGRGPGTSVTQLFGFRADVTLWETPAGSAWVLVQGGRPRFLPSPLVDTGCSSAGRLCPSQLRQGGDGPQGGFGRDLCVPFLPLCLQHHISHGFGEKTCRKGRF